MNNWRGDFPILQTQMNGKELLYFDSAASSQKPQKTIEAMDRFLSAEYSNVHRGLYALSQQATEKYESCRKDICDWLGLKNPKEIIFTGGCTQALNLLAHSLCRQCKEGDQVMVTRLEHHANFVPWQWHAQQNKMGFKIFELDSQNEIDLKAFEGALSESVKIVSFAVISNVLGYRLPWQEMAALAKKKGCLVVLDAAQALLHVDLSQEDLSCVDFLCFSPHKICAPSGLGVLWGREELLHNMEPLLFGGDMIQEVGDRESRWNKLPWKFEAGTPPITEVIGLQATLRYLSEVSLAEILKQERALTEHMLGSLKTVDKLRLFGPKNTKDRSPVFSFEIEGLHSYDLASFLEQEGVAIRTGHHCAQPLHRHLGLTASARASLLFYNTTQEIDRFVDLLKEASRFFLRDRRERKSP